MLTQPSHQTLPLMPSQYPISTKSTLKFHEKDEFPPNSSQFQSKWVFYCPTSPKFGSKWSSTSRKHFTHLVPHKPSQTCNLASKKGRKNPPNFGHDEGKKNLKFGRKVNKNGKIQRFREKWAKKFKTWEAKSLKP